MKKNIVFDFDNTLTTFDTIYPFFKFCNKDNFAMQKIKQVIWFFLILLHRLKFISNYDLKDIGIKLFLKGYDRKYIKKASLKFYDEIMYHDNILKEFVFHLELKDNVYISSASFCEYLTVFSDKYKNVKLLCSSLKYKDDKVQGLAFNNYEKNKLIYFQNENIEIDVLYTDSYSDRFLAKLSKKIKIVTKTGDLIEVNNYDEFENYFKGKK